MDDGSSKDCCFRLLRKEAICDLWARSPTPTRLSLLLTQSLTAAIWGAVCCLLLKKGKTLWHPIAAHAFYDILITFFAG